MSTTFADYSAQAEARKNIAEAVLGHTYALCEALRQNFSEYIIKMQESSLNRLEVNTETGIAYHKASIAALKNGYRGY